MAHKLERRNIKATEIRIAPGADGSQILTGYAVRFNSPSVDLGGFTEICAPGMFTRTLRESPDVLMLRDHVSSQLLGRTKAGTLTLTQDSNGLAFSVTLPNTAIAADTIENIRLKNLDACSFGFNVPDGGDKWTTTPDGLQLRTLLDVNLAECSITSFAAYPATSVSLRSCPPEIRSLFKRTNLDGCDCECASCSEDDDCSGCTMEGCEDPICAENGCPAQEEDDDDDDERSKPLSQSERHRMYMTLELLKRSIAGK
jgi:HK97 family phage prohead protease